MEELQQVIATLKHNRDKTKKYKKEKRNLKIEKYNYKGYNQKKK